MGAKSPRPVVLDTGAFIAFERNDRRVRALIELAVGNGAPLHTTAGVVAQVWRDGSKQARVARLLASGAVQIQPLDFEEAQGVGVLCGTSKTRDVVDASVALLARRHAATVVTSDPKDLRKIDSKLVTVAC